MRAMPPRGSLKQLDPRLVARRPLEIVLYGLGEVAVDLPPTQAGMLAWLKTLGFRTPAFTRLCPTAEQVMAAIDELDSIRDGFGFETDGAVVKLDSSSSGSAPASLRARRVGRRPGNTWPSRRRRGCGASRCRWAARVSSRRWRSWSPSSCAAVRSVAPRSTMRTRIRRKDIRIGDAVVIEKAGEVIPAVLRVVLEKRDPAAAPFDFLAHIGGKCRPAARRPGVIRSSRCGCARI